MSDIVKETDLDLDEFIEDENLKVKSEIERIQKEDNQLTILSNKNILEITHIFTDERAVFKRGLKQEDYKHNPLTIQEQLILIQKIINNVYNIYQEGKEKFLLSLGNGDVKYIEKNLKNFISILRVEFPLLIDNDDFENLKINELFEHLKSRKAYDFREYRSPFFKKCEFLVDEKHNALISHIKIDYKHDLDGLTKNDYDEIVEGINKHWNDKISSILRYLIASIYAVDKKNLWLLILANSNFGKSKLFDWMRAWDGSAFIKFDDIVNTGINNKKPEDYYNKVCLVIDEVMGFHRKLFEVEDTLEIRPMRAHTVYVSINARILLSADGGTFNDEYMDKQIINRVSVIDLRKGESGDLGNLPITKKYGKNNIKRVMSHYLHTEIIKLMDFYESLNKNERADEAERIINNFVEANKMQKMDFFEMVKNSMQEILLDIRGALGNKLYDEVEEFIIRDFMYKNQKGVIIKSPSSTLEKILIKYNKTLEYELKFKKVNQIADNIEGWKNGNFKFDNKPIKGLFIAYGEILTEDKIIDVATGKELF